MALTVKKFLDSVKKDRESLLERKCPEGVSACNSCGIPLQESITGNRQSGSDIHCSDCYFADFGRFLDIHQLGTLRIVRVA